MHIIEKIAPLRNALPGSNHVTGKTRRSFCPATMLDDSTTRYSNEVFRIIDQAVPGREWVLQ